MANWIFLFATHLSPMAYPAYCFGWYFSEGDMRIKAMKVIQIVLLILVVLNRIEGCMWRMYLSGVIQVAVMFPLADRIWMSYQSNTSCVLLVRLLNLLLVLVQTIKWPTPLSDVQWSTTWVNKNKNSKRLSLSLLFGGRERLDWQLVKKGLAKEL